MKNTFKNTKEINEACRFPKVVRGKQVYLNTYADKGYDTRITGVKTSKGKILASTNTGWVECDLAQIITK